ncbi:hypothetical protein P5E64_00895 [Clostridium perfringens]|nr:hypothetical protein [Clostridium perfringens]MDK0956774.1 hypothetical protein [Clostridium perfringens]MDU6015557.1 hypothetical protein [Clostridium perfringens]
MNSRKIKKNIKKTIDNTQEYIGEGIAFTVNMVLSDPTGISGTVAKTVYGKSIQALADKIDPCQLTEWEKKRVENCMVSSIERIAERINNGDELRKDDFFKEKPNGKTDAEEVFESIVVASQRESQEMEQIFYGNMLANIGFVDYLDADEFNFLLKVFEKLTYRQCLILAVFYMNYIQKVNNIATVFKGYNPIQGENIKSKQWIFYQEILDLYQKSLLFDGKILFNITQLIPSDIYTYGLGEQIVLLAGLDKIVENKNLTTKHLEDFKTILEIVADNKYANIFIKNNSIFIEDKRSFK